MKFLKGNILDADYGIIGHQVNCQLVMGAGLAKQIREKYPKVFEDYQRVMRSTSPDRRLGKCQMVEIAPTRLYIANLFGQFHYLPRKIRHTDYTALGMALRNLQKWRKMWQPEQLPVYLPSGLGCGLAGGDWDIVQGIIRDSIPDANIVRFVR
jgi:O-acetyl-ADP-ribose deacetylase (regulator of RNase III)